MRPSSLLGINSYYRARYYESQTGRFIDEDSEGFDAGIDAYAYVHNKVLSWKDPFGLDELTDDPRVRKCMCELWKLANWGWSIHERSAFVVINRDKIRDCLKWAPTNEFSSDSWSGEFPPGLQAQIHTHGTHAREGGTSTPRDPRPSTGCDKCDDAAAKKIKGPVYTISDRGVWKITPQGQITQEAGPELLNAFNQKTCECKGGSK